jgi:hypothetical protein
MRLNDRTKQLIANDVPYTDAQTAVKHFLEEHGDHLIAAMHDVPDVISIGKTISECDRIADAFDCKAARGQMLANGHTWRGADVSPSEIEIQSQIDMLLNQIKDARIRGQVVHSCGAGGFNAYLFPWGVKVSYEYIKKQSY